MHVFLRFLRVYLHTCLDTIWTGFAHFLSILHVIVGLYAQCLGITGQSAFWTVPDSNEAPEGDEAIDEPDCQENKRGSRNSTERLAYCTLTIKLQN